MPKGKFQAIASLPEVKFQLSKNLVQLSAAAPNPSVIKEYIQTR
jgi:hypothetical protein